VFVGATAQGAVSWVAPGTTPGGRSSLGPPATTVGGTQGLQSQESRGLVQATTGQVHPGTRDPCWSSLIASLTYLLRSLIKLLSSSCSFDFWLLLYGRRLCMLCSLVSFYSVSSFTTCVPAQLSFLLFPLPPPPLLPLPAALGFPLFLFSLPPLASPFSSPLPPPPRGSDLAGLGGGGGALFETKTTQACAN
jgi:hypothetical protein